MLKAANCKSESGLERIQGYKLDEIRRKISKKGPEPRPITLKSEAIQQYINLPCFFEKAEGPLYCESVTSSQWQIAGNHGFRMGKQAKNNSQGIED